MFTFDCKIFSRSFSQGQTFLNSQGLTFRKLSILFLIIIFFNYNSAFANMEISEIMYDLKDGSDTDREWIEVYNNSENSIDFSGWKFFEADTNHGLDVQNEKNIKAGGYAIIASNPQSFKIDWPNYTGTIFGSSFSLHNTGESIALKNGISDTPIDEYTYKSSLGGAGNGKSLQKISGSWSERNPTPGVENETNPTSSSSTNSSPSSSTTSSANSGSASSSTDSNNQSPSLTKTTIPEKPRIKAKIISQKSVIVGVPINLKLEITGYSGEKLTQGKFYWNLGDGMSKEYLKNEDIIYTYENPGQYIISFEYTLNYYKNEPDAIDEFVINVLEPKILISSIGLDGSITIQNNGEDQINLSNWILKSNEKEFLFPKNTIILAGKKIIFPSKVTKFTSLTTKSQLDATRVEIFLPSRIIAAVYPNLNLMSQLNATGSENKNIQQAQDKKYKSKIGATEVVSKGQTLRIQKGLTLGNESHSLTPLDLKSNSNQEKIIESGLMANVFGTNFDLPTVVFIILLITSAIVIYFINQKRIINKNGDEFKILEE
ncbi:MAG: lamin tail domain-containing protein [Patescibacteria group bacterium]